MSNNRTLSELDNSQIMRYQYDEKNEAQRVIIVAGEVPTIKIDVDPLAITNAIEKGLESFKPISEGTSRIERFEVPVIVKETHVERVEIPIIIKETELKIVEVPVKFETIKLVEVPVLVKETTIQVIKQSTLETKYLRIAVVGLLIMEILTLLLK